MTSPEPIDRTWIVQHAFAFYEAVLSHARSVRSFCRLLGIRWLDERFDNAYFAERMRQARKRKKDIHERLRALIPPRTPLGAGMEGIEPQDLDALDAVLDDCGTLSLLNSGLLAAFAASRLYDPCLYQQTLLAALKEPVVAFKDLPAILDNRRLDIVFRFVTLVSMAHYGQVLLEQPEPETILVIRRQAAWEDADAH